eukprot:scaffold571832_cov43-Prasinocladus_malaysianus.AAC.1
MVESAGRGAYAGAPPAGRLLGLLSRVPACKTEVMSHMGALIQAGNPFHNIISALIRKPNLTNSLRLILPQIVLMLYAPFFG